MGGEGGQPAPQGMQPCKLMMKGGKKPKQSNATHALTYTVGEEKRGSILHANTQAIHELSSTFNSLVFEL